MKKQRTVTFNHNPLLKRELPAWRSRLVMLGLMGCSLALAGRALYLQGVNNDFLQAKGESRYARTLEVPATRGRITDRQGDILAVSTPVRSVWAIPSDAQLEPAQARELARLLEMDVKELNGKLATGRDFTYLKRQVPPEVAQQVADLRLPGVHQQQEYRRYYPGGEVMAHILGFTDVEDKGQEGIELAFEKRLAGRPGARRVIKDRRGQIVEDVEAIRPPRDGEDVALSIDGKIQYLAWSALRDAMQQH
nr:penicillin-binding protein 2 [Thauera sp.]